MEVREARWDEFEEISKITGIPVTELCGIPVFVAAKGDRICAVLPLHTIWFAEPLVVQGSNRSESSRAAVLVYRAAEDFIASCQTPQPPPRGLFVSTRSRAVKAWSERLGWRRLFAGAAMYVKHFPR